MGAALAFDSVADRLAVDLVCLVGVRKGLLPKVSHTGEAALEGEGELSTLDTVALVALDAWVVEGEDCVTASALSCVGRSKGPGATVLVRERAGTGASGVA